MDHFDARQTLFRRKQELSERLYQLEQNLQQEMDSQAEATISQFEQMVAATAKELIHVKYVLKQLGGHLHGVCSNCGKPIGHHRLKAFPTAELCVRCANNAH